MTLALLPTANRVGAAPTHSGVGVIVGVTVGVYVAVGIGVSVGRGVFVGIGVAVGGTVGVAVGNSRAVMAEGGVGVDST